MSTRSKNASSETSGVHAPDMLDLSCTSLCKHSKIELVTTGNVEVGAHPSCTDDHPNSHEQHLSTHLGKPAISQFDLVNSRRRRKTRGEHSHLQTCSSSTPRNPITLLKRRSPSSQNIQEGIRLGERVHNSMRKYMLTGHATCERH